MTQAVPTSRGANPREKTVSFEDGQLMERYDAVLTELTALARTESVLLNQSDMPLPLGMIRRKESLSQDYALLTGELKRRARRLHDAGLLATDLLETRIRALVALMKENQRRLNARKVVTAHRVDMVMKALAEKVDRENAVTPHVVGGSDGPTVHHRA
jgi:hypothetical protein